MMLTNILKTGAAAAVIGLAIASATTTPAAARTFETRWYGDDCYRVSCNDFGYNCRRMEYLGDVGYARPRDRLMCDADGDNCHWVRTRVYDEDFDDFED